MVVGASRLGLALLFFFSLPALVPFFTVAPTRSADGLLHLYRLVQLDALWRGGVLFSRWLPDLAYGYGMPLFNYYAPLAYYLTTPLTLFGSPFSLALNLSLATALFTGAVGMFALTRALLGEIVANETRVAVGALTAGVAYLYAPYLLFNALYRGNLAEQWALAFAPFALWRFFALTRQPTALNWSFAVVAFAAVMLSHNITSLLVAPLLFLFTLVCVFAATPRPSPDITRSTVLAALSAFVVALGLSAFFWLPALVERDFVQITRVIVTPDFDYRFNFVPPAELISLLPRADAGRMNPEFPSTLGIVQVLLAAMGSAVLAARFRSRRALPLCLLGAAGVGITLMMLAVSQPLWDNLDLLSFVQLPMRIRGLVALCLAPLAGAAPVVLPRRWLTPGACAALVALVLSAVPMLYPRYARQVSPNPTPAEMFAYEQRTGVIGTTSFGEYLPVWVTNPPDRSPFEEAYAQNSPPDRFVIPEGVQVCGGEVYPTGQSICAKSSMPWRAVYRAFYFPGWSAQVNGQAVQVEPTPRTGLISFGVANGEDIRVAYTGTEIERIAEWVSVASAVLVLGVLAVGMWRRYRVSIRKAEIERATSDAPNASSHLFLALALVALALIVFKLAYADRTSNPLVAQYDGTRIEGVSQNRAAQFGGALQLLGYDMNEMPVPGNQGAVYRVRRGDALRPKLYWRALPALDRDLAVFVHLTHKDGGVVAQKDNLHPANLPTTRWELDSYAVDAHPFEIPADLAPGKYELRAGVYDPRTNTRLNTSEGGEYIVLAEIEVIE